MPDDQPGNSTSINSPHWVQRKSTARAGLMSPHTMQRTTWFLAEVAGLIAAVPCSSAKPFAYLYDCKLPDCGWCLAHCHARKREALPSFGIRKGRSKDSSLNDFGKRNDCRRTPLLDVGLPDPVFGLSEHDADLGRRGAVEIDAVVFDQRSTVPGIELVHQSRRRRRSPCPSGWAPTSRCSPRAPGAA